MPVFPFPFVCGPALFKRTAPGRGNKSCPHCLAQKTVLSAMANCAELPASNGKLHCAPSQQWQTVLSSQPAMANCAELPASNGKLHCAPSQQWQTALLASNGKLLPASSGKLHCAALPANGKLHCSSKATACIVSTMHVE